MRNNGQKTTIKPVDSENVKSEICDTILRALPRWFSDENAIAEYARTVRHMPFYAAYDGDRVVGFVALKIHNAHTAEICVMGVLPEHQTQGIGRRLVHACEDDCRATQKEFLTVKTLANSADYEPYEITRAFYKKAGFVPLEVFPLLWDKNNPCLFLAKHIEKTEPASRR